VLQLKLTGSATCAEDAKKTDRTTARKNFGGMMADFLDCELVRGVTRRRTFLEAVLTVP
jgi:hypothetical protein